MPFVNGSLLAEVMTHLVKIGMFMFEMNLIFHLSRSGSLDPWGSKGPHWSALTLMKRWGQNWMMWIKYLTTKVFKIKNYYAL